MLGGHREILREPHGSLRIQRAAGVAIDQHVAWRQGRERRADHLRLPGPKPVAPTMAADRLAMPLPVGGP